MPPTDGGYPFGEHRSEAEKPHAPQRWFAGDVIATTGRRWLRGRRLVS